MRRNYVPNIKSGDILVFKGRGFLYEVLSRLVKLFDPSWDRFGWHVGFVVGVHNTVITTCEALAQGVCLQYYPIDSLTPDKVRVYRWVVPTPNEADIYKFVNKHLGEKYDIMVYPVTALAYIIRHYWGRPIPRLFDNAWSCWEWVYYYADEFGHSIAEDYDFPMVNQMVAKLEGTQVHE
jgi:hypothetical protein